MVGEKLGCASEALLLYLVQAEVVSVVGADVKTAEGRVVWGCVTRDGGFFCRPPISRAPGRCVCRGGWGMCCFCQRNGKRKRRVLVDEKGRVDEGREMAAVGMAPFSNARGSPCRIPPTVHAHTSQPTEKTTPNAGPNLRFLSFPHPFWLQKEGKKQTNTKHDDDRR